MSSLGKSFTKWQKKNRFCSFRDYPERGKRTSSYNVYTMLTADVLAESESHGKKRGWETNVRAVCATRAWVFELKTNSWTR